MMRSVNANPGHRIDEAEPRMEASVAIAVGVEMRERGFLSERPLKEPGR
jgi:hypothetical protein